MREILMKLILASLGESHILPEKLTENELKELYSLSSAHDLSHLVGYALEKGGYSENSDEAKAAFSKQKMLAIFRSESRDYEYSRIKSLLEEGGIEYIPLKGAVIKDLYPEAWMRTSCDIDILIKPENLERAIGLITEKLGYSDEGRHFHEHSLISKSGVHLELHFTAIENVEKLDRVLERIWDYTVTTPENPYRKDLTNEFFIYHNIAHAQYHFIAGGCGVRPLIDLYLLDKKLEYSKELLDSLLHESGSLQFFAGIRELMGVWFEGKPHSELTRSMEEFIFTGGVFGSKENRVSVGISKNGSKKSYFISRIFMPRELLESIYPNLKKRPYLLPFYEVKRWFRLLKKKGRANMKQEFAAKKVLSEEPDYTKKMLNELGI